jgi:Restriction endonuclease
MAKQRALRRIPFSGEFSPGQVDLAEVLRLAANHAGDERALIEAIRAKYFAGAATHRKDATQRLEQQRKRAGNVVIGLKNYGLLDRETVSLTDIGTKLHAATPAERYDIFARHILDNCAGGDVLQSVRDLQKRGDRVTKRSLHLELARRGFAMPTATTAHQTVLNWLSKAGVIAPDDDYRIDEARFAATAGLTVETLDEVAKLTPEQRAFLQTLRGLAAVEGTTPLLTSDVYRNARVQHGEIFPDDQLSAKVLQPLAKGGWVALTGQGAGAGRGSRSGQIAATTKLISLEPSRLAPPPEQDIPPELRPLLNTPLATISADLQSSDTYRKGVALELLALRIVIHLGLHPKEFRLRSKQTGGSEVDLIAEGTHLHFSRWVIQCKNTADVHLSALDKEIGMAFRTKAHVIVLVTTGRFARGVEVAADELARESYLQVILVNGAVLRRYRELGMRHLLDHFQDQAGATMKLKKEQLRTPSS